MQSIKGGSFKTLGLHPKLLHNIHFPNPTPIQRKAIPPILNYEDIIGVARTGSGKTLCYLIPTVQRVLTHKTNAIILLPTRELASQVFRVLSKLTKNIKVECESMIGGLINETRKGETKIADFSKDFEQIEKFKTSPGRILCATLGRLRHILDEMNISLPLELLVIDEVDRIVESNMYADLLSLLDRFSSKNTILFSATLPKQILSIPNLCPTLIQIDNQLSSTLKNFFFYVPSVNKEQALVWLTRQGVRTMVFCGSRHTCEWLVSILSGYNIRCASIYSSLDQSERTKRLKRFAEKAELDVLVVTDLAARGLDLPSLDRVINYDLPDEKVFLHRVGRVARNGRPGEQYSFVTSEDIYMFANIKQSLFAGNIEIGRIPQEILDEFIIEENELKQCSVNGDKKVRKYRGKVCVPGDFVIKEFGIHSMFLSGEDKSLQSQLGIVRGGLIKDRLLKGGLIKNRKIDGNNKDMSSKNIDDISSKDMKDSKKNDYKDQFYIPYKSKSALYSSAFSVCKDEEEETKKKKVKKEDLGKSYKKWLKSKK
ncbi:ATP-dependent RNA helicase DDX54 [Astathelohania contejeani]|uniref:ATP-dependent RNA helicase DDX54 n=1 Tax=Astathelohania contejeani TaxID=164912 RepID=A0ABQ7I0H5_9MICR|nr:ATP-dependent RNA helicase DDX54 [Thelohania contejeani]